MIIAVSIELLWCVSTNYFQLGISVAKDNLFGYLILIKE